MLLVGYRMLLVWLVHREIHMGSGEQGSVFLGYTKMVVAVGFVQGLTYRGLFLEGWFLYLWLHSACIGRD